jgi:ATP-dependent helicase/nuclease subunit A
VVAAAREKMLSETEDEYRRLLYVAMTRAADRLIVAGIMPGNMNSVRKLCWYDLIGRGLQASGLQEEITETDDGPIKRYRRPDGTMPATGAMAATATTAPRELPDWLRAKVTASAANDQFLRPSDAGSKAFQRKGGESLEQRSRALQRGTLVHRLLQSLPDLAADRRRDAAQKFLARNAAAWDEAERHALAESVLALIADPRFAAVFAEGSRAEVAIVGRLDLAGGRPALVSGQIDRLVVTKNEVVIVDFKTNHTPPTTAADAPPAYVRQLALYRAVLRKLYPQHAVRAALLWTETTDLMEISAPALDAELASGSPGTGRA